MPTILKMRIVGDPGPERPDAVATPERTSPARPKITIAGITAMITSQRPQRGRTAPRTIAVPNVIQPPKKTRKLSASATKYADDDLRESYNAGSFATRKGKMM